MIEVHITTPAEAEELADTMRLRDRQEVWTSDRQTPLEAIQVGMESSEICKSLRIDGELAAIWGVRPVADGVWIVWLLTSEVVDKRPIASWRIFRLEVAHLLERYPVLCNMVDSRYEQALRCLGRAGFTIGEAVPWGVDQHPFHFCIIRKDKYAARNGTRTQEGRSQTLTQWKTEEAKGRYLERGARPIRVRHPAQERVEAPT